MSVKGFKLSNGNVVRYDYSSLDNVVTDSTLSLTGVAADAKAVGDELDGVKQDLANVSGLSDDAKIALLACFQNVAWIGDDGQDYYDDLYDALYPPATLTSITCIYTQSGTVYDTDTLDSLKSDLVVTAHYDNSTTQIVTTYTLSGTLIEGTSTITVSYGGKTTTFTVTVTEKVIETVAITWSGSGTDKTASPVINATAGDGYIQIPYVSGASQLSGTAVDGGDVIACVPYLYSDSAATNRVGYYNIDTGEVFTSSSWTWGSAPCLKFGVNKLVAPKGYYVKIVTSNVCSAFNSNGQCTTYLNTNATTVTLP